MGQPTATTTVVLPIGNQGGSVLKVLLEPLSEYFLVQPGQKIVAVAELRGTANYNFFVASSDGSLTIYAPGQMSEFVDCYATTENGVRLTPDGN